MSTRMTAREALGAAVSYNLCRLLRQIPPNRRLSADSRDAPEGSFPGRQNIFLLGAASFLQRSGF